MSEMWGERLPGEKIHESRPEKLWSRYADIRTKGKDSDLGIADFQGVINCEMLLSTHDNPPLSETFDAEQELEKLRSLPREGKRVALELFKDHLARQRHAYMQCRLLIERTIIYDPDSSTQELTRMGDFFARYYGFPDSSKKTIRELIDKYQDQHKKTRAFLAKYPDTATLLGEMTGVQVGLGNMQVSEGPLSIDMYTDRPTAELIYARTGTLDTMSKSSLGFQGINAKNGIYFTVVIDDGEDQAGTHVHEQEHLKNKVLREFFDVDPAESDTWHDLRDRIKGETDPQVRTVLRKDELRIERDYALDNVKDELTAMFKDGTSSYFYRFYEKNGNPYDYLEKQRDAYYNDPDYAELTHEILVGEYEQIIKDAIRAFTELRNGSVHTADEAIALLTDMPLDRWPSTVRHLNMHVYNYRREG